MYINIPHKIHVENISHTETIQVSKFSYNILATLKTYSAGKFICIYIIVLYLCTKHMYILYMSSRHFVCVCVCVYICIQHIYI